MANTPALPRPAQSPGLLSRLAHDRAGNAFAMLAAAVLPVIALVGGGIDMGRSYLAQTRIQQACDSSVLAARKRLSQTADNPDERMAAVQEAGTRFFNANFRDGAYGTQNRNFSITLNPDNSIVGEASVEVPTSLMAVFGMEEMDLAVECEAIYDQTDIDLMFVLDTTGSMRRTNPGDTVSRFEALKNSVLLMHDKLESNNSAGAEIRYGFVPYNGNVNVGALLADDWVTTDWTYQSREEGWSTTDTDSWYTYSNYVQTGGDRTGPFVVSEYPATYYPASGDEAAYYACEGGKPADTWVQDKTELSRETTVDPGPPETTITVVKMEKVNNGTRYKTERDGDICRLTGNTDTDYRETYDQIWYEQPSELYIYKPIMFDMSAWRTEQDGCIEERDTYQITDYANIDLARALDLDIDLVPSPGNPATQWRPRNPDKIYARSIRGGGFGEFTVEEVESTEPYFQSGKQWISKCPSPARKLATMTSEEVEAYLSGLSLGGSTYHDIGMIWGGRLTSPTGLFASENADTLDKRKDRNLIWMTDGQTEAYDIAYNAYGLEPLDLRRWDPSTSTLTHNQVVEQRFLAACNEVKKKNITVWVVAFGTALNPIMEQCAGPGRAFQADNADELTQAFLTIGSTLGDLRLSR